MGCLPRCPSGLFLTAVLLHSQKKCSYSFHLNKPHTTQNVRKLKLNVTMNPTSVKFCLCTAGLSYKDKIAVLTSVCQKSLAQQRDHWSGYLPGPWRTVCASMDTSCLVEFPSSWQNRSSKEGKAQEQFSDGLQCNVQDAEQDATKYSISGKTWYLSWHCLVAMAARANEQNAELFHLEPVISIKFICCNKNNEN